MTETKEHIPAMDPELKELVDGIQYHILDDGPPNTAFHDDFSIQLYTGKYPVIRESLTKEDWEKVKEGKEKQVARYIGLRIMLAEVVISDPSWVAEQLKSENTFGEIVREAVETGRVEKHETLI